MKAISLWQPWASLWCSEWKVHETRHWPTNYRGPIAVHAAKRLVSQCGPELDELCIDVFGPHWRAELPRGALVGVVELVSCESTTGWVSAAGSDALCGDFSPNRFAWRRGTFRTLPVAYPYRGQQGFFQVPDELVAPAANGTGDA